MHHPGFSLGISADLVRFPDQQFAVVCLCNQDAVDATTLALQIADLYLAEYMVTQASTPQRSTQVDRVILASYAGFYRETEDGQTCTILLQADQLILQLHEWHVEIPLIPITATLFQSERALDPMLVQFDQPSHPQPLCFHFEMVGKMRRTFVVCPGLNPEPTQLDAYVGTYWSDELQATYTFSRTDDRLIWTALNCALQPAIPDEFTGAGMCFAFQRDADHLVRGFLLTGHEVRNICFTRVGYSGQ